MIALPCDDDGFMTELEIADKILAFLFGGHDTATATITFSMKYLAEMLHAYDEVVRGIISFVYLFIKFMGLYTKLARSVSIQTNIMLKICSENASSLVCSS
jgi:hypothetical protein